MTTLPFNSSVRASRAIVPEGSTPEQTFELFPTPPWATRALLEEVLPIVGIRAPLGVVLDPCAGLGHMSDVLRAYARTVMAHDIHLYALEGGGTTEQYGVEQADFLTTYVAPRPDWIIFNPPFTGSETQKRQGGLACLMVEKALKDARVGVAALLRPQWLHGETRYARLFAVGPPSIVAPFAERVPMLRGGWDPKASSASDYTWFVWLQGWIAPTQLHFIPPGARERWTETADALLAARCVPGFRERPLI